MAINEKEMKIAEDIRSDYSPKVETEFDKLRKLDKSVRRPAEIFAYIFGVVGSLVLGVGMCFAMKVIGNIMAIGIVIGIVGIAMVSLNYFIYKAILAKRKKKFREKIMEMSDNLINA